MRSLLFDETVNGLTLYYRVAVSITIIIFGVSTQANLWAQDSLSPSTRFDTGALLEPDWRFQTLVGVSLQSSGEDEVEERGRRHFEIGIYRTYTAYDFHHPDPFFSHGLAAEVSLGNEPIYGLRYGASLGIWMFTVGAQLVYYTDGRQRDIRVRPEFGLGTRILRLSLGYNARIYRDADFRALQPHSMQLSLGIFLGRSARAPSPNRRDLGL